MRKNSDWIRAVLSRRETEAIPYNFSFSPKALRRLRDYYGTESIEDRLDFPIRMIAPVSVKPLYTDPAQFGDAARDEFGVAMKTRVSFA